MKDLEEKLKNSSRKIFSDAKPTHDYYHHLRVWNMCKKLEKKNNADLEVLMGAALLHDWHRKVGEEFTHPKETLDLVEEKLKEVNFPKHKINHTLECIKHHEDYSFGEEKVEDKHIELAILKDADNLDAIGAIGIARTFSFGGDQENLLWNPKKKADKSYNREDLETSTINHMKEKLVKLEKEMTLDISKQIASQRIEYLKNFIEKFEKEWEAEDF